MPKPIASFALAIAVALGACTTVQEGEPPAPGAQTGDAPKGPAAPGAPVESKPVPRTDLPARPGAPATKAAAKAPGAPDKRSVYFDFDQFDIKAEYRPLVEAHAKYLHENSEARMLIQGHADERGSREYNVGLGQRRAESVQKMLVLLGASAKQVEAVSLGEEKPVCTQSSEDCWWRNRRAEMLYTGEY